MSEDRPPYGEPLHPVTVSALPLDALKRAVAWSRKRTLREVMQTIEEVGRQYALPSSTVVFFTRAVQALEEEG